MHLPKRFRLWTAVTLIPAALLLTAHPGRTQHIGAVDHPADDQPLDYAPRFRHVIWQDYAVALSSLPRVQDCSHVLFLRDPALGIRSDGPGNEPSIAIDPSNPNHVVITSFLFPLLWDDTHPEGVWSSDDGGDTWTQQFTLPKPPGTQNGGPYDQTVDYGRDYLYGAFLCISGGINTYTPSNFEIAEREAWEYHLISGNAEKTNNAHVGNSDQAYILVNRDPEDPAKDLVYVAYDDFGSSGVPMRVAVADGINAPHFGIDGSPGSSSPTEANPGHRLGGDRSNGFVYSLYQRAADRGFTGLKKVAYVLNRTTDGGKTWGLNGSATGIVIATRDSNQAPGSKFGGVNALLGGVTSVTADPTTSDVYCVIGDRDADGNNRLKALRFVDDGAGGLTLASESFVGVTGDDGPMQSALPSIAIADNGVLGALYDTFDGIDAASGFPTFTAHFAVSSDQGATWCDEILLTFLSTSKSTSDSRQRVLGDYHQVKAAGLKFYGVFAGNGAPLGQPEATIDPIFFCATAE